MSSLIPVLNYASFLKGNSHAFVAEVKKALETTGFFLLENHGISSNLLLENRRLFDIFFKKLTLEQRMNYCFPDLYYQKGYTPMNMETGEYAKTPDFKHFFQVGEEEMQSIIEVPGLRDVTQALYGNFNSLYKQIMGVVAMSLGLDQEFFNSQFGNSVARHIHYPAHSNPVSRDKEVEEVTEGGNVLGMCASRHTDINDLTLLHATEPGLELLHNDEWVPVLCDPSIIIINTGDMLWHLTGGRYKSGQHRVVCEPGVERMSSPFFGHRSDESSVVPLKHLGESDLEKFHFKTEGEFLSYRLEQIGLK